MSQAEIKQPAVIEITQFALESIRPPEKGGNLEHLTQHSSYGKSTLKSPLFV